MSDTSGSTKQQQKQLAQREKRQQEMLARKQKQATKRKDQAQAEAERLAVKANKALNKANERADTEAAALNRQADAMQLSRMRGAVADVQQFYRDKTKSSGKKTPLYQRRVFMGTLGLWFVISLYLLMNSVMAQVKTGAQIYHHAALQMAQLFITFVVPAYFFSDPGRGQVGLGFYIFWWSLLGVAIFSFAELTTDGEFVRPNYFVLIGWVLVTLVSTFFVIRRRRKRYLKKRQATADAGATGDGGTKTKKRGFGLPSMSMFQRGAKGTDETTPLLARDGGDGVDELINQDAEGLIDFSDEDNDERGGKLDPDDLESGLTNLTGASGTRVPDADVDVSKFVNADAQVDEVAPIKRGLFGRKKKKKGKTGSVNVQPDTTNPMVL